MFAMRHSSRLLLCRLGFVLLCVLPTSLVGIWIVSCQLFLSSPAQKAEWERELTHRLGLVVQIEQVRYQRISLAELIGCRMLDAETRTTVAEIDHVNVRRDTNGWQVAASLLSVEGSQLGLLARMIDERLLRGTAAEGAGDRETSIHFTANDVLVRRAETQQTIQQLGGELQLDVSGARVVAQFRLAGTAADSQPIRLTGERQRSQANPTTQWELDAAGVSVPCSLAADLLPELSRLGADCTFAGVVQLSQSPAGSRGQLSGTLTHVDLDTLITELFPHQLSGTATVKIEQCLIEHSKLAELRGTVQATRGAISQSFIAAAAEHLGLDAGVPMDDGNAASMIPFRQLAIGFRLNAQALALTGSADPTQAGALLANAAGPILSAPPDHSVAAVGLLRTLLPDSEHQVPATRQTAALVRLFPVPDLAPAAAARWPSHTPTRLVPATTQPVQSAIRPPVLR
jgi:hypothetical protein